ncbi:hypothetical protein QG37_01258 [Candidozyma auris]|nr:hypothetical protein QG37_01258 [[Candida] auris]
MIWGNLKEEAGKRAKFKGSCGKSWFSFALELSVYEIR